MTSPGAFVYLVSRTAKNRLLSRLRRARNPRYALAMAIGAFYLFFIYVRPQLTASKGPPHSPVNDAGIWLIASTLVAITLAAFAWLVADMPSSLAMDDAELMFIMPAPVSRRRIVAYKVLRAQLAVLTTVVIWSVIGRRSNLLIAWPLRFVAMWIVFSTLSLHRMIADVICARRSTARRWAKATIAAILAIVGWSLYSKFRAVVPSNMLWFDAHEAAAAQALTTGVAGALLYPLRALIAPVMATSNVGWLQVLPAAMTVLALHALAVATLDERSIDATIIAGSDRLAKLRRRKPGDIADDASITARKRAQRVLKTMPLAPTGWPGMAIVWKNFLCLRRKARPTTLILIMLVPVIAMSAGFAASSKGFTLNGLAVGVAVTGAVCALLLMLMAPILVRIDLRSDMANIVAIKQMPLSGLEIVASEVLSVVAPVGVVQSGIIIVSALALQGMTTPLFGLAETVLILAAGVPALLVFNAAFISVQNVSAVLFPAWTKLGVTQGGMEAMGQMVINLMLVGGLLGVMMLAPVVVGGAIIFIARGHLAPAIAAGSLLGAAALAVEVAAVIAFLGRALERTEPNQVPA